MKRKAKSPTSVAVFVEKAHRQHKPFEECPDCGTCRRCALAVEAELGRLLQAESARDELAGKVGELEGRIAAAFQHIADNGCDCDDPDDETCLAHRIERALRGHSYLAPKPPQAE